MLKSLNKELETLKKQEQTKAAAYHDLGILEAQKHEILHYLSSINQEQNETKKELEDKYGKINIDLKDGSYEQVVEDVIEE